MAEQLKEVRNDITSFLEGFTKACNEDLEAEKVASVTYLQYAYCINAYLQKKMYLCALFVGQRRFYVIQPWS